MRAAMCRCPPLSRADAEAAVDRLLAEGVEGHRGLPGAFLRQSGAREDDPGDRAREGARPAAVHQLRRAARDQGVRTHLDHGHQHLCAAHRGALPGSAARRPGRGGDHRAAASDAVQRRADSRRDGARQADEHHRIRSPPGALSAPRRWRGAAAFPTSSPSTWAVPRPKALDDRERQLHPRARLSGGRRHHDGLAASHRLGLPVEGTGHRSGRGRRGGRFHRLDRCGRGVADRTPKAPGRCRGRCATTSAARIRRSPTPTYCSAISIPNIWSAGRCGSTSSARAKFLMRPSRRR